LSEFLNALLLANCHGDRVVLWLPCVQETLAVWNLGQPNLIWCHKWHASAASTSMSMSCHVRQQCCLVLRQ